MTFKRRPPVGNVRRVRSTGTNMRSTLTNKANRLIQTESFHEKALVLRLEFDPSVIDFESQPEALTYIDSSGHNHRYVPDFRVHRTDGSIEIHEVSMEKNRLRAEIQLRENAGHAICAERGWAYVVHTDRTLPQGAELANLELLYGFRSLAYAHELIASFVLDYLEDNTPKNLPLLLTDCSSALQLPYGVVCSALLHMVWHSQVKTNLNRLLFIRSHPVPDTLVWREQGVHHG